MHVELTQQYSEKVMSDSSGPVVFAIDLVDSVLYNLPDGESEVFLGEFKLQEICDQSGQELFLASS